MIISGKTDKEHLQNINTVLDRLESYSLTANLIKCHFFNDKITYCGHVTDGDGLHHKSPDKVEAVVKSPRHENMTQLRSFLGLVNYYRRFLPNLATVEAPLNQLLQHDNTWCWTDECDQSFQKVKELITSEQVLCHYNPKLPVKLACDASPHGLGSLLSHITEDGTERPVAFASRSLTKAETGYSQIDKKALGLCWVYKSSTPISTVVVILL
ncbi:uncharacterized protein [Argopecten irradians]|uniref:uncharacterized protein n=1 Tax=Argopecten irradians TaxID=31199 RepID=UPI00370FBD69